MEMHPCGTEGRCREATSTQQARHTLLFIGAVSEGLRGDTHGQSAATFLWGAGGMVSTVSVSEGTGGEDGLTAACCGHTLVPLRPWTCTMPPWFREKRGADQKMPSSFLLLMSLLIWHTEHTGHQRVMQ